MKAVDGQENPFVTIETSKFSEVQKYLSITRHAYTPNLLLYSKKLWNQLNKEERAVLQEAALIARDVQRKASRLSDEESLAHLKAIGMSVNDVPQQERDRMLEKIKPVYDKTLAGYNKEGPDLVFATLKKIRGK
jgi:TRAP-type C4-dicarboxylate transport system substrate-binding protein